ncbi:hypothetical protein BLNAU_9433 [Blattamonas nauphoetae]|uniref:Uncharacterized protein n=1 Tax=Blattamonas nauphoetae TaxID=2049346 RepID=A0ABQ9XVR7_9EUKA|nr:hypothetical protein BLNAU_9433 [Blattamonas nauphoetae]
MLIGAPSETCECGGRDREQRTKERAGREREPCLSHFPLRISVQPDCADVVGFRSPPFARPDITTAAFCDSSQIVDDVSSHSTGGNEESVRHAGQWIGCRRVVASGSSFEQHNEILTAVDGRVVWKSNSDESVYPQTLSTRSAAADEPSPIAEEGKSNQIILNSADETSMNLSEFYKRREDEEALILLVLERIKDQLRSVPVLPRPVNEDNLMMCSLEELETMLLHAEEALIDALRPSIDREVKAISADFFSIFF